MYLIPYVEGSVGTLVGGPKSTPLVVPLEIARSRGLFLLKDPLDPASIDRLAKALDAAEENPKSWVLA